MYVCVPATTVAVEMQQVLYSDSVFVALGVQHAIRERHTVMLPARLYNRFPHLLIKGKILENDY